jgi:Zn-dependent protease
MEASIRLGKIRDIELGIHYSWFIVFVVFSIILATEQYPGTYEGWSDTQYWTIGIASVLLLFISVIIHEFGHAITAQREGIPVQSIVLFIFGGVATITRESEEPGDEFKIAIAGPITSAALAGLFGAAWAAVGDSSEQVSALLGHLAFVNLALAIFNLIPGFPLDGGRVLRAIIWKATGSLRKATRVVSFIGIGVGALFLFIGVLAIVNGNLANGLWGIALGWFLQNAASQGYASLVQRDILRDVSVHQLMDTQPAVVAPDVSVEQLVMRHILGENVRGALVVDDNALLGIVTLTDIKELERERWPETSVREIMTGRDALYSVTPDAQLVAALERMVQHDLNQMPVLDGDRLVGMVSRSDFMRYLQMREELGLLDPAAILSRAPRPDARAVATGRGDGTASPGA